MQNSIVIFLTTNTPFDQTWSKKLKLSVEAEIWYLKYEEFNGDVNFFLFSTGFFLGEILSKKSKLLKMKFIT